MNDARCDNCQFSDVLGGMLHCRRYPPTIVMVQTPNGVGPATILPRMAPNEWCGEFKIGIKIESQMPQLGGKILKL